jgi:uncharacterized DUF497 family protein
MTVGISGFDWDDGNREKCQKHGVSPAEIEALLCTSDLSVSDDREHSQKEPRFLAFGRSKTGRYLIVACTLREMEGGGPVSARSVPATCMRRR